MKKVAYVSTLLVGLFSTLNSIAIFNAANNIKSQGGQPFVGPAKIDATLLATLGVVLGIAALVGAIGGLTKKKWAKQVSLVALGCLVAILVYQSSLIMVLLFLIPVGLLLFS